MFNCHRRTVSQNSSHVTFPYPKSPAAQLQRPRYKHSRSQSPWTWTLFQCSKALRNRDTIRWVVRVQHDKYTTSKGLSVKPSTHGGPIFGHQRSCSVERSAELLLAIRRCSFPLTFTICPGSTFASWKIWVPRVCLLNLWPKNAATGALHSSKHQLFWVWMVWVLLVLWLQLHIFASHLWISPPSRSHHWKPATDELNMEGMTQIPLPMKWCSRGQWCINHHSHLRLSYLQDYILLIPPFQKKKEIYIYDILWYINHI